MKKIMFLLAAALAVSTASAETLKWSYQAESPLPYSNGSVGVVADGTGGCVVFGALSVPGNADAKLGRTIWLNSLGHVIFTNDFRVTNGQAFVQRVTKTDLYVGGTEYLPTSGTYSNFTIRVQRKGATATIVPTKITINEVLITGAELDTKGFFTVEILHGEQGDTIAGIVRRYLNR